MVKRKREDASAKARPTNGKSARFEPSASIAAVKAPMTKASFKIPKRPSDENILKVDEAATAIGRSLSDDPMLGSTSFQIITGSYERVLHGFAATVDARPRYGTLPILDLPKEPVTFTDTFLFTAHSSAIRCLATSPPTESHKRILASGSTDERINLYNLSTTPPTADSKARIPNLSKTMVVENPQNRELGSLLHHASGVNKLDFPTKGKLFSGADDNTVAISRTRDWTVLSTIKVPIPKAVGRPSGDTAGPGEVPAGVNDFAIHPSMKVMLSVSKGERSMRLWNLVTGKKAAVLNFDRDILQAVGEGKHSSGEGRKVHWSTEGEQFVVAFERGAIIYNMESQSTAIIRPSPPTKFHDMIFLRTPVDYESQNILAIATEDGRILFYDTLKATQETKLTTQKKSAALPPTCQAVAQLGGAAAGIAGRIKAFTVLQLVDPEKALSEVLIFTGSSDGAVRLWSCVDSELYSGDESADPSENGNADEKATKDTNGVSAIEQVGTLIGTYETGHRITCLTAFVLDGPTAAEEAQEDDLSEGQADEVSSSDEE